jgi:hypothetical protein
MMLGVDESGEVTRAVRGCLEQILPKRRSREIVLDPPECHDKAGVAAAFDVTVAAMAAGVITPDEALTVSKVLERRRRSLEAKARQAGRGDDAAAVTNSGEETPARAGAPDLHPACNYRPDEAAAAPEAAAAAVAEPMPTAPRRPLRTSGSACNSPVFTGSVTRHAGPLLSCPLPPSPPAIDCPPSPCFPTRTSRRRPATPRLHASLSGGLLAPFS